MGLEDATQLATQLGDIGRYRATRDNTATTITPAQTTQNGIGQHEPDGPGRPLKVAARVRTPYGLPDNTRSEALLGGPLSDPDRSACRLRDPTSGNQSSAEPDRSRSPTGRQTLGEPARRRRQFTSQPGQRPTGRYERQPPTGTSHTRSRFTWLLVTGRMRLSSCRCSPASSRCPPGRRCTRWRTGPSREPL